MAEPTILVAGTPSSGTAPSQFAVPGPMHNAPVVLVPSSSQVEIPSDDSSLIMRIAVGGTQSDMSLRHNITGNLGLGTYSEDQSYPQSLPMVVPDSLEYLGGSVSIADESFAPPSSGAQGDRRDEGIIEGIIAASQEGENPAEGGVPLDPQPLAPPANIQEADQNPEPVGNNVGTETSKPQSPRSPSQSHSEETTPNGTPVRVRPSIPAPLPSSPFGGPGPSQDPDAWIALKVDEENLGRRGRKSRKVSHSPNRRVERSPLRHNIVQDPESQESLPPLRPAMLDDTQLEDPFAHRAGPPQPTILVPNTPSNPKESSSGASYRNYPTSAQAPHQIGTGDSQSQSQSQSQYNPVASSNPISSIPPSLPPPKQAPSTPPRSTPPRSSPPPHPITPTQQCGTFPENEVLIGFPINPDRSSPIHASPRISRDVNGFEVIASTPQGPSPNEDIDMSSDDNLMRDQRDRTIIVNRRDAPLQESARLLGKRPVQSPRTPRVSKPGAKSVPAANPTPVPFPIQPIARPNEDVTVNQNKEQQGPPKSLKPSESSENIPPPRVANSPSPVAGPSRAGKRKRTSSHSTSSKSKKSKPTLPKVFARWGDSNFYPASVAGRVGEGKYSVAYDDGDFDDININHLRKMELRVGDEVECYGSATRGAGIVRDLSRWGEPDGFAVVTIKTKDGERAADVPSASLRIPQKIITRAWKDRLVSIDDLALPSVDDDDAELNPSRDGSAAVSAADSRGSSKPIKKEPIASRKRSSDSRKRSKDSDSVFAGKAFVITLQPKGRKDNQLDALREDIEGPIVEGGGMVASSWDELFSQGESLDDIEWIGDEDIDGVFLLADQPTGTVKYLMALALGIPCISTKWVSDCLKGDDVDWRSYILSAGFSDYIDSECSQFMDPRWGSYDRDLSDLLDGTVSRKPLSGHSVLLIHKPAKDDRSLTGQKLRHILCAAGASSAELVTTPARAKNVLTEYDWVIVNDNVALMNRLKKEDVNAVDVSKWLKQTLISGAARRLS